MHIQDIRTSMMTGSATELGVVRKQTT